MADASAPDAERTDEDDLRLAHEEGKHTEYVRGCPDCTAEFDTPPDPDPAEEPAPVEVAQPTPKTPYDRLVVLLTAPTRCSHCGRTDPMTPAGVAAAVGLSESAVRRLMSEDVQPSMRAVTTMAARLNVSTVKLLEELWPAMAQPAS